MASFGMVRSACLGHSDSQESNMKHTSAGISIRKTFSDA